MLIRFWYIFKVIILISFVMNFQIVSSVIGGCAILGLSSHYAWRDYKFSLLSGLVGAGLRTGGSFGFLFGTLLGLVLGRYVKDGHPRNAFIGAIFRVLSCTIIGTGAGIFVERSFLGWWI